MRENIILTFVLIGIGLFIGGAFNIHGGFGCMVLGFGIVYGAISLFEP